MKNYCLEVFGGIRNVKELFVNELRRKRLEKGLSPEDVDRMVGLGPEWPTVREIESNPDLFTLVFNQQLMNITIAGQHERPKMPFELGGEGSELYIREYLSKPGNLEKVLRDFKDHGYIVHGTVMSKDPDEYIRRMLEGEPVKEFAPNMLSPTNYAEIYIFTRMISELHASDRNLPF